jgi:hypothetical protein
LQGSDFLAQVCNSSSSSGKWLEILWSAAVTLLLFGHCSREHRASVVHGRAEGKAQWKWIAPSTEVHGVRGSPGWGAGSVPALGIFPSSLNCHRWACESQSSAQFMIHTLYSSACVSVTLSLSSHKFSGSRLSPLFFICPENGVEEALCVLEIIF